MLANCDKARLFQGEKGPFPPSSFRFLLAFYGRYGSRLGHFRMELRAGLQRTNRRRSGEPERPSVPYQIGQADERDRGSRLVGTEVELKLATSRSALRKAM